MFWSLDQEDPLEKEMPTYSSILAWKNPRQRSLAGYSPMGRKEWNMTKQLNDWAQTQAYVYS